MVRATETPALALGRQQLERLRQELKQLEQGPLTAEQMRLAQALFREIEEIEALQQALACLARVAGVA